MITELKHAGEAGKLLPEFNLGRSKGKIDLRIKQMEEQQYVLRLWSKDATLWGEPKGSKEIIHSLGWLNVIDKMITALPMLWKFEVETKAAGFSQAVLLGMGGSSLSTLVFEQMVKPEEKGMPVIVIDTTDPETIASLTKDINLEDTLF
ncbi:MAG: hypothetical protein H0X62_03015, partial [Bacteroidetes bacterium]|nr:hypothetical protein [Bacteroidota bacterium]